MPDHRQLTVQLVALGLERGDRGSELGADLLVRGGLNGALGLEHLELLLERLQAFLELGAVLREDILLGVPLGQRFGVLGGPLRLQLLVLLIPLRASLLMFALPLGTRPFVLGGERALVFLVGGERRVALAGEGVEIVERVFVLVEQRVAIRDGGLELLRERADRGLEAGDGGPQLSGLLLVRRGRLFGLRAAIRPDWPGERTRSAAPAPAPRPAMLERVDRRAQLGRLLLVRRDRFIQRPLPRRLRDASGRPPDRVRGSWPRPVSSSSVATAFRSSSTCWA